MSTGPVNLNKFRKQRAKAEKLQRAQENVIRFGRTKAEKSADKARRDKAARDLDGIRRK